MLTKSRRLSRVSFLHTKKQGRSHHFSHFSLLVVVNSLKFCRYSVVTSAKFHPLAVVRNHIRRTLYDLVGSLPGNFDIIIYPKPTLLDLNHEDLVSVFSQALSTLTSH